MASSGDARLYRQVQGKACSVVGALLALTVALSWAQLDQKGKQFLLDSHNDFRASVGASNMRLMEWSSELAEAAQQTARSCLNQPTPQSSRTEALRETEYDYSWVEENQYVGANGTVVVTALEEAMDCWFNDGCSSATAVTQNQRRNMLWADSHVLGCGAVNCPGSPTTRAIPNGGPYIICFYAPGALDGEPYITGTACADCPNEAPVCVADLCGSDGAVTTVPEEPVEEDLPTIPYVWYITPTFGSRAGGTRVTIVGRGFASDQFNFFDPSNGDGVTFSADGVVMLCDVETYSTNDEQIVCITRPSPEPLLQDYYMAVSVTVNGRNVMDYGGTVCGGSTCTFRYSDWNTPKSADTSPHATLPGGDEWTININGRILTLNVSDTQVESDDNEPVDGHLSQYITRLLVGGEICDPYDDLNNTIYGGELDEHGSGYISCRPATRRIDSFNATFILSAYGNSQQELEILAVDNKLRQYTFQTHSDISSVWPREGSPEGGTLVTITGQYFSDDLGDVKAFVGGVPCEVVDYDFETIHCITGPAPARTTYYPGGRGIVWEVWTEDFTNSLNTLEQRELNYPDGDNYVIQERAFRDSNYPSVFGEQMRFNSRYTGFFVPPVSSLYTFNIFSDDHSRLYFSPNASSDHKEVIAYAPQWTRNRWDYFPQQVSEPIYLEAGSVHYVELLHIDGGGAWSLGFGAKIHNLNWTDDRALADHEVQRIVISSEIIHEKQKVIVRATPKIQQLCLNGSNVTFQLSVNGSTTNNLSTMSSISEIDEALNNLPDIMAVGMIEVLVDAQPERWCLSVIFLSQSDSLPTITMTANTEHEAAVQQNSLSDFQIGFGPRNTEFLPYQIDSSDLKTNITQLFGTECSRSITGRVFFADTYEYTVPRYNSPVVDNSVEALCGRYSVRNPRHTYRAGSSVDELTGDVYNEDLIIGPNPNRNQYRYACFWYTGIVPNNVLRFRGWSGNRNLFLRASLDPPRAIYNDWKFVCIDMFEVLIAAFDDNAPSYVVDRIFFDFASDESQVFWVDEFYVTTSIITVTPTIPAVRPNGVFVDEVIVTGGSLEVPRLNCTSSDPLSCFMVVSEFEVEFVAVDCGFGMPLMEPSESARVTRIAAASPPVVGYFNLSLLGQTIHDLPVDISAEDLLERMDSTFAAEGGFEVKKSGSCYGFQWEVRWSNKGGDQLPMNVSGVLDGNLPSIEVQTVIDGGVWIRPFRGDMLRLPEKEPQVEVSVNGIPASCQSRNCSFTFSEEIAPKIHSIFPTSGGQDSSPITIFGSNFSDNASLITVTLGDADCEVVTANETEITCIPALRTAGPVAVRVHVANVGYSISSPSTRQRRELDDSVRREITFEYSVVVNSISPTNGSISGANLVTISGRGFPVMDPRNNTDTDLTDDFYVLFDSYPCFVVESSLTEISCQPQPHTPGLVDVTVSVNGVVSTQMGGYQYSLDYTALVDSVTPDEGPVMGGTQLTITGTNFGTCLDCLHIFIDNSSCTATSITVSEIVCITTDHAPGNYSVFIHSTQFGIAVLREVTEYLSSISSPAIGLGDFSSDSESGLGSGYSGGMSGNDSFHVLPLPTFTYKLMVTGVSPCDGSVLGGTTLTITGSGFGTNQDIVSVTTNQGRPCQLTSLDDTTIQCITPSASQEHIITNYDSYLGLSWTPAETTIEVGDTVTWEWTGEFINADLEVHQTDRSTSFAYDGNGFSSEESRMGTFSYTFTSPGTYYYASYVDNQFQFENNLRGVIYVAKASPKQAYISVRVTEHEALYEVDYTNRSLNYDSSGFGSGALFEPFDPEECTSCYQLSKLDVLHSNPIFVYNPCYTPVVFSIEPGYPALNDDIIIDGVLLTNESIVTFGMYTCQSVELLSYDDTTVRCRIDSSAQPLPFMQFPLSLHVPNLGQALVSGQISEDRSISIQPAITDFSPNLGSVLGGNVITITGTSFTSDNAVVTIGEQECTDVTISYDEIMCTVPSSQSMTESQYVPLLISFGDNGNATCKRESGCLYLYTTDIPTVTAISPTTVAGSQTIQLQFDREVAQGNTTIHTGEYLCSDVMAINATTLSCDLVPIPAGIYSVSVLISDIGHVLFNTTNSITSALELASVTPVTGSTQGGTGLTISGSGFSHMEQMNSVVINGNPCEVSSSSYSFIVCTTPANEQGNYDIQVTVNSVTQSYASFFYNDSITPTVQSITPTSGQIGDVVTITGFGFTNSSSAAVGRVECSVTEITATQITCTLGAHFVGTYPVTVLVPGIGKASGDVTFYYTLIAQQISPQEGSYAGNNEVTITGVGFNPVATLISICDRRCLPGSSPPTLTTIGCIVPSFTDLSMSDDKVCNVTISSMSSEVHLEGAYTFRASLTPVVTQLNRTRGGTAGGSIIEVSGSGFSGEVNVSIADVPCVVMSSSEDSIVCQTGASGRSVRAQVMVYVSGKGFAFSDGIEFFYVDVWSSRYTWGGEDPPGEGFFVIVPAGQTLLLDVEQTPILTMLLIQGGEVIFDDEQDLVELRSENILIVDGGRLQIGTEEQPYQNQARIVMYGNVLSTEIPLFGAKTLSVRDGSLDLHGRHIEPTWTKLDSTAAAGDTQLVLQEAVSGWEVGGKIVIASTSFSQRENEELTITAISADNRTLTVEPPLEYTHISYKQTIHDQYIDTSAEVGYLTRNVIIRGNLNSEWVQSFENCEEDFRPGQFEVQTCFNGRFGAEEVGDQFGSQIMLHRGPNDHVVGRIEYVEVTHAGQAFRLGRYPIHFHLNGDVSDSYVRGCSIHHTFNRAVTIHGVDNLLVEKNVAFNILGHAYFLEDGIEQGNIIQDNLGIFVRASSSLLNVDITPATYWIVNPNNTVRRNAAAGGTHFGYWYRLPTNPTGPSFTPDVFPIRLPLGGFYDNTAHSFGWYGIWIFPSYHPVNRDSCDEKEPAVFERFLAWRNQKGVEFVSIGAVQLYNSILIDNREAGVEVTLCEVPWGEDGARIENVLIVAHSGLREHDAVPACTQSGIKAPKTYYLTVSNVTFVNFDEPDCYVLQACSFCRPLQGGYETRYEQITLDNSNYITKWKWTHEHVHRDLDGTLTGYPGGALIPTTASLPPEHCEPHGGTRLSDVEGSVCDEFPQFRRFALADPTPSSLEARQLNVTNQYGTTQVPFVFKRLVLGPSYMAILPIEEVYELEWDDGERFTNLSYTARFSGMTNEDHVWVQHNFLQPVDFVSINGQEQNSSLSFPEAESAMNGDWYAADNGTSIVYFITGDDSCPRIEDFTFTSFKCFFENCISPPAPEPPTTVTPEDTFLWSNSSIWPNNMLPVDGDDVYINCSYSVIVDVPLPRLGMLTVCGYLQFMDTNNTLEADLIVVDKIGRLIVGTEEEPFESEFQIILNGNLESPEYRLPNDGPVLGAKALGIFGELSLYGSAREVTWTFLRQIALKGSSQIMLVDPVDWQPGEEIVISSTSFEALEAEMFTIVTISSDGYTLTLDGVLQYTHLGGDHSADCCSVDISAEVGLLTRNIKIVSGDPDQAGKDSFGCRVLVSEYYSDDGVYYTGSAKISGVEFKGCGQEGYVEPNDPRFALAFLNLAQIVDNSSYVRMSSFHSGFSTALGAFNTDGMIISDNVIHRTVSHSVRITGNDYTLIHNLAVVALFPGTYDGRMDDFNGEWTANYELAEVSGLLLIDNSAAGGARAGFHTDGENCIPDTFVSKWKGNIAHSTLHGVHSAFTDGHFVGSEFGCSAFFDFHVYSCYHYGIFSYSPAAIYLSGTTLVNNYAGLFTAVIGPPALTHQTSKKIVKIENTRVISTVDSIDCTSYSLEPESAKHPTAFDGLQSRSGGHVGILLSVFTSEPGTYPVHAWNQLASYPAITGLTKMESTTFCNFASQCDGKEEYALLPFRNSEDANHPVEMQGIQFQCVEEGYKFFNQRPALGSINPSDCVDMDCDGLKKILLRDLDGSFSGTGTFTTIISMSEFEWDMDPRRGLGDYRIPRLMLAEPDGGMIDPDEIYPNKGIYRGSPDTCTLMDSWNAYRCSGPDHMMMVLESLDEDTEVRRLSPIGIGADTYIDLVNGPQDHGWCGGYTCQERISTFYTIVATGLEYSIGLTSTNPQRMNIYLLNASPSQSIVVGIYYTNPQRLDIYDGSQYILPTNAFIADDGNINYKRDEVADFVPKPGDPHGANYYDRTEKKLYIVVTGDEPIRIETTPVVVVSLTLPPVTVDEFFETNLISNLAFLLNVPPEKIRIVNVIAENSRKRQIASTTVEFEIGDAPKNESEPATLPTTSPTDNTPYNGSTPTTAAPVDNSTTSFEQLQGIQSMMAVVIQTGQLEQTINMTVLEAEITEAEPPRMDPTGGVRATNMTGGPQPGDNGTANLTTVSDQQLMEEEIRENETSPVLLRIPSQLQLLQRPSSGIEGQKLSLPFRVAVLDNTNEIVPNLGIGMPWIVTATIIQGPPESFLINESTEIGTGVAEFTSLIFSHQGTYSIRFSITYPTSVSFSFTTTIMISTRNLRIAIVSTPLAGNTSRTIYPYPEFQVTERSTGDVASNLGWRGRSWYGRVTVINATSGGETDISSTLLIENGVVKFAGIQIQQPGSYQLRYSVFTTPSSPNDEVPLPQTGPNFQVTQIQFSRFIVTYNNSYEDLVQGAEDEFASAFINTILQRYTGVEVYNVALTSGSIVVSFFATSASAKTLQDFATSITSQDGSTTLSFTFGNTELVVTSVEQDPNYPIALPTESPMSEPEEMSYLVIILVCSIGGGLLLLVLIALIIFFCCCCCLTKKKHDKELIFKPESQTNLYELNTVYQNPPIFDDDSNPVFHLVADDENGRIGVSKESRIPHSQSDFSVNNPAGMEYVVSKEVKVGGDQSSFTFNKDPPQYSSLDNKQPLV